MLDRASVTSRQADPRHQDRHGRPLIVTLPNHWTNIVFVDVENVRKKFNFRLSSRE